MSIQIPNWYVEQFSTNIQMVLQYKGSKLSPLVENGTHVGDQASPVDFLGSVEAQDVTTRFEQMPRTDATLSRRWVSPTDCDVNQLIDKFDKLRLLTNPESKYVMNAVRALGRKKDRRILNAFHAASKTGVKGGSTTPYPTANTITVSAYGGTNSRLNVAKMIALKELMESQFVDFDEEEVYIAITAKDNSALMNEALVTSQDFNPQDRPVLKDGKIRFFLGFNIVHVELVESVMTGTNKVTLPVWAKSGMYHGVWNDITTNVSQRNDLRGEPFQAYAYMTDGATRLEENKVYGVESYRA